VFGRWLTAACAAGVRFVVLEGLMRSGKSCLTEQPFALGMSQSVNIELDDSCESQPRGPRSIGVLPTLAEDLLDVVGRPYDGVDYVVLDDVRETMLDPAKGDHPLATVGVVAQTACDVAANLNLHSRLAEVDIAVVAQLKAHHVLHDPVKPLRIADKKVRRSEAIREVWDDGQGERACCWSAVPPRARAVSR
jgi:hypothetical protein